jgi:hypothetical protein
LGVTGIVDGKSLLQYYFVYTLINKLCQLHSCSKADLQQQSADNDDACFGQSLNTVSVVPAAVVVVVVVVVVV